MNNNEENVLTHNEVAVILIGIMFGINVATLPNNLVKIAEQDSWISTALAAMYPLYVIFISVYISKKFPDKNIFKISEQYFGKLLGKMMNILFTLSILAYLPASLSLLVIIVKNYAVTFVSSFKIYIAVLSVTTYCACKGIKAVRRICSINFYIILLVFFISLGILKQGSLLNLKPMLATNLTNLVTASFYSMYDYSCIEVIFLLYPFINDLSKLKRAGIKSVVFVCFMYTYTVFISIYYLGIDVIPKTYWAFFSVTEDVKFINIANFRFMFLFFLIFIALKSITIYYYFFALSLDNIVKIHNKEILYVFVSMALIYICDKYYSNLINRDVILKITVPLSITYNLFYISLIALLIFIRKDGQNAKK